MTKDIPEFRQPAAVFCDFDGTITESDMIVSIWRQFATPGWEKIKDDALAQRITVREGVAKVFASIPSNRRQDIVNFAMKEVRFRTGFRQFLVFCHKHEIPFYVTSGALNFFLEPIMEPFKFWLSGMYSMPADCSGPTIKVLHPLACETCGLCKARAMAEHPGLFSILIGDSVTDLHGATEANLVFARDRLKGYLDAKGVAYEPFETFVDIMHTLEDKYLHAARA